MNANFLQVYKLESMLILYLYVCSGNCALLDLSQSPVSISNPVPPNVVFSLDDAGSMDWEFLVDSYWSGCAYDPNSTGSYSSDPTCGSLIKAGGIFYAYDGSNNHYFSYFYKNADNAYNDTCNKNNDQSSVESCGIFNTIDWRAYAADLNHIYYDPSTIYTPWVGPCYSSGASCVNASFSAATSYPVDSLPGYSLTRNLDNSRYEVWIDDHGFTGSRPYRTSSLNVTNSGNNIVDLWDSHVTIVFGSANVQVFSTSYAPTVTGMNPTQTLQATLSSTGTCYNILGPDSLVKSIFQGALTYNSTGAAGCRTISQAKTNFANWYQYGRRRSFAARAAISSVINYYPTFRFGLNVSHQVNPFMVEVPPLPPQNYSAHNQSLLRTLFIYPWQPQPSKLRFGLDNIGVYYSNKLPQATGNPVTESCQQNYAVLMTDGYWNDNFNPTYSDVDGDGIPVTLADVARYYYINDLSPLPNNVAPNPWDPATWQHMVTYTIGLGVKGNLTAGSDGWPTPALQVNSNWGNPYASNAAQIDDLWHAAFNSKGMFFQGQNPQDLSNTFNIILGNIEVRNASSTTVAQNSTVLNTSSQVYQAVYTSTDWHGGLLAYNISLNGVLASTPSWDAGCVLTGGNCTLPSGVNPGILPNNRTIITRDWSGQNSAIAFRWPSNYSTLKVSGTLPVNLASFLANAPFDANTINASEISSNQQYGQALLNYIRGDQSQEIQNQGSYNFRNRSSLLGDIVDSGPIYVAAPMRYYPDSIEALPYSAFKQSNANRTPVVYVGANDGMLHAFRVSDGRELMAYIPGAKEIYQHLPMLSKPTYPHYFFVNGASTEADVYFNSAWHTILADNLKNGGQSVFALDITNPDSFSENAPNSIYLWEFSDQNDPDLGFVGGSAVIGKVRSGAGQSKWAVIIGNGYNNSQPDGYASTTGKASLFILFIEDGKNGSWVPNLSYIKIPVGTGSTATPNGLAQPYPVDIDGDYIIDYIYAGDLQGNIWKFDVRDSTPTNWQSKASILFTAYNATAGDQPITAPVIVGPGPTGLANGVMVYFGTGKFLEPSDNSSSNQVTQSFYGIWDQLNGTTVTKNKLVQQRILAEVTPSSSTSAYRVVSSNSINWASPNQNLGWYLNLIVNGSASNNGERQISAPLLRGGNVIFTTLVPSISLCTFGGSSWLMELNANSGGTPNLTPFDVNNDGVFSSADYLTITVDGNTLKVPAAGQKSDVGIISTPAVFIAPDKSSETKVISGGVGLSTIKENASSQIGRQNWKQIY